MRFKCFYSNPVLSLLLTALLCVNIVCGQTPSTATQKSTTKAENSTVKEGNSTPQPTVIVSSVKNPVISVNLDLNTFSDYLPFDVDFKIAGGSSNDKIQICDIISIDCYYIDKGGLSDIPKDPTQLKKWTHLQWINQQTSNLYWFNIKALKPNKHFSFVFKYKRVLTDPEKTKLTTLIQPCILPLINSKAIKGNLEFSTQQIINVVQTLEKKINDTLKMDGLTANFQEIDSVKYQNLFTSAHKIVEAYKTTQDYLMDFKKTVVSIQTEDSLLTKFRDKYYEKTPNSVDKEKNMKALGAVHQAIYKLFTYPVDQQATDAVQAKTYTDESIRVIDTLIQVRLLQDSEFLLRKTHINDIAGSIGYKFIKYRNALLEQQSINNNKLDPFIDAVSATLYNDISISGSSANGDFVTRANTYVCADLGIALLPVITKLTPYIGTNIYFRPINTNAPLKWCDHEQYPDGNWRDWLGRRLSLVIGVSVVSIAKTYVRSDLMGSSFNLIIGIGFRITDWVRISSGALWYSKLNDNPLNTTQTITPTPFISISFDLRIKTALNNLFAPSVISSVSP
jgi:hypothetical protein